MSTIFGSSTRPMLAAAVGAIFLLGLLLGFVLGWVFRGSASVRRPPAVDVEDMVDSTHRP
jgi:hypothetical protein